jgi:ubiquitin C-terminal hydrolase
MFGLRNQRGSCWVNATLQSIFRIPELQDRFNKDDADSRNAIEVCLQEIWASNGEEGLNDFYECVKTSLMPAGEGIGDSHELLQLLCDKIPLLDKLCRFKVAHSIKCNNPNCTYKETRMDSMTEFSIAPQIRKQSVSETIVEASKPFVISSWKCEKCSQLGCTKQFLVGNFPQVLVFHMTSVDASVSYTPVLVMNGIKYALFSVVCFSGGHWWAYGRNLPPGNDWHTLDDRNVRNHGPMQFPVSDHMRLLMYSRI